MQALVRIPDNSVYLVSSEEVMLKVAQELRRLDPTATLEAKSDAENVFILTCSPNKRADLIKTLREQYFLDVTEDATV